MNYEIERKFLVDGEYKSQAFTHFRIVQGYLSSVPERVVRIRIQDNSAFLTIKITVSDSEFTRFEWEREIAVEDAEEMLQFCEKEIVEKTRYLVKVGEHLFEVNENGRPVHVDKLRVLNGKGFGRLYSTGTSFSYSINQDTFGKLFNKDGRAKDDDIDEGENMIDDGTLGTNPEDDIPMNQPRSSFDRDQPDSDKFDEYGYMKPGVTWNLSFNYSLRYGYDSEFDFDKLEYKGKLTHSLGINGALQPTENWSFTFNTDYNFDLKKLSYVNCTLTRDLHCWSMSASFIPIGPYKSYNFIIRAKSSMLQDLKYEQRSSQYQNMEWY